MKGWSPVVQIYRVLWQWRELEIRQLLLPRAMEWSIEVPGTGDSLIPRRESTSNKKAQVKVVFFIPGTAKQGNIWGHRCTSSRRTPGTGLLNDNCTATESQVCQIDPLPWQTWLQIQKGLEEDIERGGRFLYYLLRFCSWVAEKCWCIRFRVAQLT